MRRLWAMMLAIVVGTVSALGTLVRVEQRQAELIEQVGKESDVVVLRDDTAVIAGKGRILLVEISDTISFGNAFITHRKQVKVKGRLLEHGKEVGSFTRVRSSMGGAFAGFKGSSASSRVV